MMTKRRIALYLGAIGFVLLTLVLWYVWAFVLGHRTAFAKFSGERAYRDVQTQVAFGPRTPGSQAHAKFLDWLRAELESAGWQVEIQQSESMGHPIQNLVAHRTDTPPQLILGAHYDSRI